MKAHYGYQSTVEPPTPPTAPYPQLACAKRGLRIFRGQGVLATLNGKLETDHVLLVFFLGYFFFLSLQKEGIVMVPWCLIFEPPLARPPMQTVVLEMF